MSSWYEDKTPRPARRSWLDEEKPPPNKRAHIVIQALIFTPVAVLCGIGIGVALTNIFAGNSGYVVMLFVTGILFLVVGYQAWHYLRDMAAQPTASEGEVTKKWTKGNFFFFFMHSHYIAVKGQIYTISRNEYRGLLEEDMVRIQHYPHSLTVVFVERYDDADKKFVPAEPDEPAR